jgi:putative transposase
MKANGYNHAIFENLTNTFGKSFYEKGEVNYNRIIKEIHLCSLKDMFEHIAINYGIVVSKVQPEYTSKTCSHCGCIDDNNRLNQEEFKCVSCGFECNADVNAAINILNRVVLAVLRKPLLKETKIGNGTFEPKNVEREKVKEVVLSCRCKQETVMDVTQSC